MGLGLLLPGGRLGGLPISIFNAHALTRELQAQRLKHRAKRASSVSKHRQATAPLYQSSPSTQVTCAIHAHHCTTSSWTQLCRSPNTWTQRIPNTFGRNEWWMLDVWIFRVNSPPKTVSSEGPCSAKHTHFIVGCTVASWGVSN